MFIRRLIVTAFAIAAALVIAATVVLARRAADVTTTSDTAVIESYTRFASRGTLLVGPYSRFQWHHPGPLSFYALAPFYRMSGARPAGLNAGALCVNLAALAVVIGLLWRRASPDIATAVSLLLALFAWRGAEALDSPWNPHLVAVPLVALVVSAADVLAGRNATLLAVALFASLAAQSHVALLPVTLAIGVVAFAAVLLRVRAHDAGIRSRAQRAAFGTLGLLCLLWLPVLIEQMTASPGNLTLLWRFFVTSPAEGQTLSVAGSAWSDMLAGVLRPDFYVAHGWRFVESPVLWAEAFALIQVAGLCVVMFRRERFDRALAMVLAAATALALWSVSRAEDALFDHAVFWIVGLGTLNTGVLVGAAMTLVSQAGVSMTRRFHLATALVPVACLAVATWSGLDRLAADVGLSRTPSSEATAAGAIGRDLAQYIQAQQLQRPLIRIDQDAWGVAAGSIVTLQKMGVAVAVDDDWLPMFGPSLRATGREPVILVSAAAEHVRLQAQRGYRAISDHAPFFAGVSGSDGTASR